MTKRWNQLKEFAVEIHDLVPGSNESTTIITIESDEKTPLLGSTWKKTSSARLRRKRELCDFRALSIGVLLVGGFSIATYLMVMEYHIPPASFSLDLVNRDVWSQAMIPLEKQINEAKILQILIVHTGGRTCADLDSCIDILRDMQEMNLQGDVTYEIAYNFLIGSDGVTYEARGWNHESGLNLLPHQSSFVIGFIGNYTTVAPTDLQCISALSVINEAVRRNKLHTSYQVFGVRNFSLSHNDGEALFSRISKWQRFYSLLHVL